VQNLSKSVEIAKVNGKKFAATLLYGPHCSTIQQLVCRCLCFVQTDVFVEQFRL